MRTWALVFAAIGIVLAARVPALYGDPGNEKEKAAARKAEKAFFARLEEEGHIGGSRVGYEIWVGEVKGQRLIQPIFIRLNARGGNEWVTRAREAEVKIDARKSELVIRMRQGVGSARDGSRVWFADRTFTVPLPVTKEGK
jgi:hypothetical protein